MGIGIKRAIEKRSIRSAYTLAEVVIVMLVVAVIVGVSIKITKAKLDNIVSYTYYSGYSTLRNVTKQVVADFSTDEDKKYLELPSGALSFLNKIFAQRAIAKSCYVEKSYSDTEKQCTNYELVSACTVKNWDCKSHIGEYGITASLCDEGQAVPYGLWLTQGKSSYKDNIDMVDNVFYKLIEEGKLSGYYWTAWSNPPTCLNSWNGGLPTGHGFSCHDTDMSQKCDSNAMVLVTSTEIVPKDDDPAPTGCTTTPSDEETKAQYCQGKEFDQTTCSWKDITPWPPCGNNKGTHWSQNSCACVPEPPTIPRKGQNFCEKFVSYANTKSNSAECSGDAIPTDLIDFSDKTADITLRNGMRIYNIRQNPAPIQVLDNNIQGASYDGVDNVNEYGYTVYLDIDGEKGPSTLWQDVYPFYITMSGTVIPAYNMTVNSEETGGNSRHHLMTSIEKESVDATGHRKLYWISKSVSYKEGACSAGYIGASTAYCHGVPLKASCSGTDGTCILKYVSPVKFFQ